MTNPKSTPKPSRRQSTKGYQKKLNQVHKFDDQIVDHMYDAARLLREVFHDHEYRADLEREHGRVVNELMLYDDLDDRIPGLTALGYGFSTLNQMYEHFPIRASWTGQNAAKIRKEAQAREATPTPSEEEEKKTYHRVTAEELRKAKQSTNEAKGQRDEFQKQLCEAKRKIGQLEQLVEQLRAENAELREQLTQNQVQSVGV